MNVPVGFDLENLYLEGFEESDVTFYIPISITRVSETIWVAWPQGILQSTDSVGAGWTDVGGATSPHEIAPTDPRQFFRVKPE